MKRNKYFEVIGRLNIDNQGDNKVRFARLINVDQIATERARFNKLLRPSITSYVVKAIATVLEQPEFAYARVVPIKDWLRGERLEQFQGPIDISVASEQDDPSAPQLVYVGTIRDVGSLNVQGITGELQRIQNRSRDHGERFALFTKIIKWLPTWLALKVLRMPNLSKQLWHQHRGQSVIISSPAKYGVDMVVGDWPWPIGVSFGLIKKRPIVVDDQIVAAQTMYVTMSFDRRLMGGAPAARFFNAICNQLETMHTLGRDYE